MGSAIDLHPCASLPQGAVRFAELVDRVAAVDPEMRVRFTSPHPKDFPDELLAVMVQRPNVCKQVRPFATVCV
jgi:tRNA A37 methylthiotransferase MiaB